MKIEKTLSLGTILHLFGVVVTIVALYTGVVARLSAIETKVDAMWRWFAVRMEEMERAR